MSVSFIAELSPVYCCLVLAFFRALLGGANNAILCKVIHSGNLKVLTVLESYLPLHGGYPLGGWVLEMLVNVSKNMKQI